MNVDISLFHPVLNIISNSTCFAARLSTPLLSVTNPSPVSIRLYWESLNYPVDSWTVEAMPIPFNEEASSNDPAYLDDELIPRFKHVSTFVVWLK